jgi:heat shock protein HslJ
MGFVVRVTGAVCLLVVAVGLVGCAVGGSYGLDGTEWTLREWSVSSIDPGDHEVTLSFDDGIAGGKAPVNSYGGSYEAKPGRSFRVAEVASTLMAGDERAMRAEAAYFELLRSARRYEVDGDSLVLSDAQGNTVLAFERR